MAIPFVTLKPSKDIPLRAGHPWIFSEALEKGPDFASGELVQVKSFRGELLGTGYWNGKTSIRVRMLSLDPSEKIDGEFFVRRFRELDAWKRRHLPADTNGYRLVHAESDGLPGLIVDRFADAIVFQIHTAGMDRLRDLVVDALKEAFSPRAIVERSDVDVRRVEGLNDQPVAVRFGEISAPVEFQEAGVKFLADTLEGQKTGFFLDQRDARIKLGNLAKGKRVLNLFCYSGAFSVHAALGGASFVANVDVSHSALEYAQKNFAVNGLDVEDESRFLFLEADVFDLLRDREIPGGPYDIIICDPPALAKTSAHLENALKTYTQLNKDCLEMLAPGGVLISSSCSGRVDPEAFRSMLKIASGRAHRNVRLLDWITQPIDHAERLSFPEGRYLKTAFLEVTQKL